MRDAQIKKEVEQMFAKLDNWIDDNAGIDYHHKTLVMVNYALLGRVINLRSREDKICAYFTYSPEVIGYIANYSPERLFKFLERVAKTFVVKH